jgi:hypothetical protein
MESDTFAKCKKKLKNLLLSEQYEEADEFFERVVDNVTISEEEIEKLETVYMENA